MFSRSGLRQSYCRIACNPNHLSPLIRTHPSASLTNVLIVLLVCAGVPTIAENRLIVDVWFIARLIRTQLTCTLSPMVSRLLTSLANWVPTTLTGFVQEVLSLRPILGIIDWRMGVSSCVRLFTPQLGKWTNRLRSHCARLRCNGPFSPLADTLPSSLLIH